MYCIIKQERIEFKIANLLVDIFIFMTKIMFHFKWLICIVVVEVFENGASMILLELEILE